MNTQIHVSTIKEKKNISLEYGEYYTVDEIEEMNEEDQYWRDWSRGLDHQDYPDY